MALAFLELASLLPRFKNANASAGFILLLLTPLAVISAVCGWLLSLGGGYEADLLAWHKWLGTATAVGCVIAAICFQKEKIIAYRLALFVTVALLMVTGHLGGSLTHGSDYLTRYAPWPLKQLLGGKVENTSSVVPAGDPLREPVFASVILPIFENKCVSCHGPDKSKGGLRMDSFTMMQKGSEDGPVFTPGDAGQSPLVQRVLLPADNDDHMPPTGKPQLTANEIALLKWWVQAGADGGKMLAELQPPPEILSILAARQ